MDGTPVDNNRLVLAPFLNTLTVRASPSLSVSQYPKHRLIQRPVHQSFGLVKCTLGLVGLAKKGVFGSHIGSCDLINWVIFSFLLF